MTDKSAATQAVKVTDWDAYAAERHAEKLRQTRQRLNDRVAVLTEFGADGLKLADEVARLRAELAAARDVVRPLLFAIDDISLAEDLAYQYPTQEWAEISGARDAAAEWLMAQGVAV